MGWGLWLLHDLPACLRRAHEYHVSKKRVLPSEERGEGGAAFSKERELTNINTCSLKDYRSLTQLVQVIVCWCMSCHSLRLTALCLTIPGLQCVNAAPVGESGRGGGPANEAPQRGTARRACRK